MKNYDLIVIGFGKAGKTLAKFVAETGKKVAVVEKSEDMYGGTCVNIGCIPTKVLVNDSLIKIKVEEELLVNVKFEDAIFRKKEVVRVLNEKNYELLESNDNIDIYENRGFFRNNKELSLIDKRGNIRETVTGDIFVINTGAETVIPDIQGLKKSRNVYTSSEIMDFTRLPKKLVIIGGSFIGLEFASTFANYGSKVTVIEKLERILPEEDEEVVNYIVKDLENKGINFVLGAEINEVQDVDKISKILTDKGVFDADTILVATGRKPVTKGLGLENTDVKIGDKGEIIVNKFLQTDVENIFAVGDVKGGAQFTYISLDDFRIVKDKLFGNSQRSTENRGSIPYTIFIDPPFSRVGITAKEAVEKGIDILEGKLKVSQMPRHKINNDDRGIFKVVVDKKERLILGASFYGKQSEELINIIRLAIEQKIDVDVLKNGIYTHPTMVECFNDLFNL